MLTVGVYLPPRAEAQKSPEKTAKQSTDKNDPSTFTYVDNRRDETKAQTPQGKPPNGYISPEWAIVIVGIITFVVIGWQSWETRKSAAATLKSVKLQEGQLRQWVNTPDKWELKCQDDLRRIVEVSITISLGIENPTPMLLTLTKITTVMMGQTKEFPVGVTLPPEEVYVLEIPVTIAGEDFAQFKTDSLKTNISMRIDFVDAFGVGQVQDLNYTAICGQHRIRDLCHTKNT
jgi:hypothetical protein